MGSLHSGTGRQRMPTHLRRSATPRSPECVMYQHPSRYLMSPRIAESPYCSSRSLRASSAYTDRFIQSDFAKLISCERLTEVGDMAIPLSTPESKLHGTILALLR